MSEFRVADLAVGAPDAADKTVVEIYYRVARTFAVYRTEERVMVQFADSDNEDPQLGANQRKSMTDLFATRGEIDSLLAELRDECDGAARNLARRTRRGLADALMIALTGGTNQAAQDLAAIKAELVEDRGSRMRAGYLVWAAGCGVAIILLAWWIGHYISGAVEKSLCFSAGVGVVGALFSIVIAIRSRSIDTTHPKLDIFVDAGLRVLVGAMSGVLLYALIQSGAFGFSIGSKEIVSDATMFTSRGDDWLLVLLVAFVAGFSQQIVPDLLAKATATDAPAKPAMPPGAAARDAASSEANPSGGTAERSATAPAAKRALDPDADTDDCCDRPATDDVVTPDTELPEAVGGVETLPTDGGQAAAGGRP